MRVILIKKIRTAEFRLFSKILRISCPHLTIAYSLITKAQPIALPSMVSYYFVESRKSEIETVMMAQIAMSSLSYVPKH